LLSLKLLLAKERQQREYQTVLHLVSALGNICAASPVMIIDALTGFLWDEEEAGEIKRANDVALREKDNEHES
jgi:hypothetical protein